MSISMNNHETRIKALENKTKSSLSITKLSLNVNGLAFFSNGLQFIWGKKTDKGAVVFHTPFTTKALHVVCTAHGTGNRDAYDLAVTTISRTGFSIQYNASGVYYFAIGY